MKPRTKILAVVIPSNQPKDLSDDDRSVLQRLREGALTVSEIVDRSGIHHLHVERSLDYLEFRGCLICE